ncbi:nitrite/sulfite reductase [Ramlibacter tataouinensis]|uniref:Ferredoxin--nitrite reductase-like protein n=1 Tax=Ramlibacter tataouinensis (strain ATCC BAA-407 / DSM 14655 / LMG 21543 / TTB310) TaxID=365046 RepID=F5XZZ7_RAMTT|nr:nitrite/sulfite reductase [Ramlibacter tataouinensis]AEG93358.1 ferredoxin--nitrite reductase-like protein [Ramlibacter tataouinensis TTB310]
MYHYTEFDKHFVRARAAQYRDQLERWQAGRLTDDEFRPLRLQNGWYIQRYAPMLRIAVPYGDISSTQLRTLAKIAREYDQPDAELLRQAQDKQLALGEVPVPGGTPVATRLKHGYGHFTTRTNVQFNWIPIDKSAEVMELLAGVDMHGIQTSGNTIRNITTDELAGIAVDEVADPRPFAEILRQWSTLHPEFAFLPRKFKVALNGTKEDRAALGWYDIGLQLVRNEAGELGFKVLVGGGMGRTPIIGTVVRAFLPWQHLLNYVEACIRVYNEYGRRDNLWKARIKILVKAEGQRYIDKVEEEFRAIVERDGAPHTLTQAEYDRVAASIVAPALKAVARKGADAQVHQIVRADAEADPLYRRWLERNVRAHKNPQLRAVTLSFKRLGYAPGDATAEQMEFAADLAERFSAGEARLTHEQNLLLPWVHQDDLPQLWAAARKAGLAKPNIGLLTDMIACPGGDFCSLANARSLPIAEAITQRYQDLDEEFDLGDIRLNISGCINSCGHHHAGHIGILGVDKDGKEWYQVTLGGSDGTDLSGPATPGKVVGPSFSAAEVPVVIEAVLDTYRRERQAGGDGRSETFTATLKRVGIEPFKAAANGARFVERETA